MSLIFCSLNTVKIWLLRVTKIVRIASPAAAILASGLNGHILTVFIFQGMSTLSIQSDLVKVKKPFKGDVPEGILKWPTCENRVLISDSYA